MGEKSKLSKLKGDHEIIDRLAKYEKEGANILIPSIVIETGIKGILQPAIEALEFSSNPKEGDVYPQWPGLALTGKALFDLSSAACVEWNLQASERTANERDYTAYKAVGGIRKADGKLYQMFAERDIDMITIAKDIRDKNALAEAKDKKSEAKIVAEIAQIRKFKLPNSQTKSQNAVIRKLLGVKNVYTKAEIEKPFVVLRFSYQPDMDDKDIAKMLMNQFMGANRQIYGPGAAQQIAHEPVIDIEPAEVVEPEPEEKPETEQPKKETCEPSRQEVFEGYDKKAKIETIKKAMEIKGYDGPATPEAIGNFSDEDLNGFFKKLDAMENKKEETPDDQPPY